MWVAYYKRMRLNGGIYKTEIQATSRFVATAWYYFWALCYCINPFSTKQVSLYRTVKGVIHLRGKKGMSSVAEKSEPKEVWVWNPDARGGQGAEERGWRCEECGKLSTGMGACKHCGSNIC